VVNRSIWLSRLAISLLFCQSNISISVRDRFLLQPTPPNHTHNCSYAADAEFDKISTYPYTITTRNPATNLDRCPPPIGQGLPPKMFIIRLTGSKVEELPSFHSSLMHLGQSILGLASQEVQFFGDLNWVYQLCLASQRMMWCSPSLRLRFRAKCPLA
jgi:hypothetical protein